MHFSMGRGMHVEVGQPHKQLPLPNIQMPPLSGRQSAATATGIGKGKDSREADEDCRERERGVSCCFREAVPCQGIGRRLLLLGLEHRPGHG